MKINDPNLFIEINESSLTFVTLRFNENQVIEAIEQNKVENNLFDKNKFLNIDEIQIIIKNNVEKIEKKLNFIFKEVSVILDFFEYKCINISGFKKLNGSQILKENISYILNVLKSSILENQKENTIQQIFNSKSVLDGTMVQNLPIGLFGNFYNHELTFFLLKNNDLRNINHIFNKNNLKVSKIFNKDFLNGVSLIENKKDDGNFFIINIGKKRSSLNFFDNYSFRYSQSFNFGSEIIAQDIARVCSLEQAFVKKILEDEIYKEKISNENEILEEKYFSHNNYKKISKKLVYDVANARIEEICNIIFKKNINILLFKRHNLNVYIHLKDQAVFQNFKKDFKYFLSKNNKLQINFIKHPKTIDLVKKASHLSTYGWNKEAVPVYQTKKSLVARIFKYLFD